MKKMIVDFRFMAMLITFFGCTHINYAQLFSDSFEQDISQSDAVFDNWTTENISGWHYWHIIPGGGVEGSQCMRFENNDVYNEDWLVTRLIEAGDYQNVKLRFSALHRAGQNAPELLYTYAYNGDASQSTWAKLDFNLGENENQWYSSGDLLVENQGKDLYFAFHYKSDPENAMYLLLDNFEVSPYDPPVPMTLVGSSEHFEYYTNINGAENYYQDIDSMLEKKYLNYLSLWYRPGFDPIFPVEGKIKINYCEIADIPLFTPLTPSWDCGAVDIGNGMIYLAPFETVEQQEYYGSLNALAVNEFSQLALIGWQDTGIDSWYLEGFGLYEMGFRPSRDEIMQMIANLGTQEPDPVLLHDISYLHLPGNKDLMASFFESMALLNCYYYNNYWVDTRQWWQLLKHYYVKDTDRIELLYSTEHFDYYGAAKEIPYMEAMALNMEQQFAMQENRFQVEIHHRINICIYDNEVGKEINNRYDFQGLACGADKINSSHLEIGDYGLLNHEFMHSLVNICSNHDPGPGQFLNEGLAESTDAFMSDEEIPAHAYKIRDLYYHYQRKYNREPTFLEIVDNVEVNVEDPFWVDAYALGEMYWRFMNDRYPESFWIKVKMFLARGRDWTVFGGLSTEEEGAAFIRFMKELANLTPPLEARKLPFVESFSAGFKGWTLMKHTANHNWLWKDDEGIGASACAKIYDALGEEMKDVDSWLVTPGLQCEGVDSVCLEFAFKYYGNETSLELYHTDEFTGHLGTADWELIEDVELGASNGQWNTVKKNIACSGDRVFIALRFNSEGDNQAYYLVDNFDVTAKSSTTNIKGEHIQKNKLSVYPNPLVEKSIVSFDISEAGKTKLDICNSQGVKVATLFNMYATPGRYTVPLNPDNLCKGIYICRLQNGKKVNTVKFIVK